MRPRKKSHSLGGCQAPQSEPNEKENQHFRTLNIQNFTPRAPIFMQFFLEVTRNLNYEKNEPQKKSLSLRVCQAPQSESNKKENQYFRTLNSVKSICVSFRTCVVPLFSDGIICTVFRGAFFCTT